MPELDVYELLDSYRKKYSMPSSEEIVRMAFQEVGLSGASTLDRTGVPPEKILANFNGYLRSVFDKSLEVLERYEMRVYGPTLREIANYHASELAKFETGKKAFSEKAGDMLEYLYPYLWRMDLSRSNSRKQRGGKDFEQQLGTLLTLAGISFEEQIKTFHSDFILPSRAFFDKDKPRSVLLSAKRTLRERWQNLVNEIYETRCPNAYLCTADEKISFEVIERMRKYNLHLVVWDEFKAKKFPDEPVVMGFSQLATKDIPLFKNFWT